MTWNRFDYSRKLVGITIIFLTCFDYFSNGGKNVFIGLGMFLILEHYFIWDRWDAFDFLLGHEWWGMYLLFFGLLFTGNWVMALMSLVGFLIGATYNPFNPFKSFKNTIKEFLAK